jgi:nucleotide-binding universal stress UspA family protein
VDDPSATHSDDGRTNGPILFCFDGSDEAASAIASAARMLAQRVAVVLTAWERAADWLPYDPATIVTAPVSRFVARALGLDEIACEVARETAERGVEVARAAGFKANARIAEGKIWRSICDVAEELDAEAIVVGARGLSRVQSALLGSVSSAVAVHAHRPVLIIPTEHHHSD